MFFRNLRNGLLGSTFLFSSLAAHASGPNPHDIYIRSINWGGKGCPVGSATGTLSADRKAFTTIFDEFYAEQGPGTSPRDRRSSCQITLDIHYPHGWQFSLFDVDYRGYVDLDRGTLAKLRSEYYFTGGQGPVFQKVFSGLRGGDFLESVRLGISSVVWSPCGINRPLNIKTSVSTGGNRSKSAFIGVDTIDGELKKLFHYYQIRWRRCR